MMHGQKNIKLAHSCYLVCECEPQITGILSTASPSVRYPFSPPSLTRHSGIRSRNKSSFTLIFVTENKGCMKIVPVILLTEQGGVRTL